MPPQPDTGEYLRRMRIAAAHVAQRVESQPEIEWSVLTCTTCGLPFAADRSLAGRFVCHVCQPGAEDAK